MAYYGCFAIPPLDVCASNYSGRFSKDIVSHSFWTKSMLSLWAIDAQISLAVQQDPLTVYLHTLKPDMLIQGNAQGSETVVGNCERVWVLGGGSGGVDIMFPIESRCHVSWLWSQEIGIMLSIRRCSGLQVGLGERCGWAALGEVSAASTGLIETMRSSCFSAKREEWAGFCY